MKHGVRTIAKALIFIAFIFFVSVRPSIADIGQYGGYGSPEPTQTLMVDKLVSRNPTQGTDLNTVEYVDNLSISDRHFNPEDSLAFKLKVKNTSTTIITNVKLEDLVPAYIDPQPGVTGWNSANRIITIQVGDLQPNEQKDYIIPMRVTAAANLPITQGVICVINKGKVSSEKTTNEHTSQFCIEKPSLTPTPTGTPTPTPGPSSTPTPTSAPNATIVPQTGPEFGVLVTGLEFVGLAAGIVLKRKIS